MKTISLKIEESIFGETERILSQVKKPCNRYINEAIAYYNRIQKRVLLEQKLKHESNIVGKESLNVLKDFENIDYAD
jgi:hypothetical protein